MILTKEVEICIVPSNIKFYRNLKLNIKMMTKIIIPIELLSSQSNIKIDVSCDRCEIKRNIKYQAYNFNINRSVDKKTYMCDKCSHEKIKQTNLKKYGVEYFSQTNEFNEKVKKTSMWKFGSEHYSKTNEYIEKRNETNLKKYGVENPFQLTDMIKSSMYLKYGVTHPSQIESLKKDKNLNRRKTKEINGDWIKLVDTSDWNKYKNIVRTQTLKNKKFLLEQWNGYDYYDNEYIKNNLNLHYFDDSYPTIDHKIPIYYGFLNKMKSEEISDISNLVFTKRIINIKKGKNI